MIELSAPAKINLFLHILHRRQDGYHELVTRMQKIDLCDRLKIDLSDEPGVVFTCSDKALSEEVINLAEVAAQKFLEAAQLSDLRGVRIHLEKNIPIAAGLGGGSSDAGSVLKGLNALLEYPLSPGSLTELAKSIGADVPFFAASHNAVIATGTGEYLSAVPDIEGFWILLVNPGFGVSTRSIFENYALTTVSKNSKVPSSRINGLDIFSPEQMHNDLEPVAMLGHPMINTIKQSLIETGAVAAMMSGSGPTVYGLFPSKTFTAQKMKDLEDHFKQVYGPRVYTTRAYAGA